MSENSVSLLTDVALPPPELPPHRTKAAVRHLTESHFIEPSSAVTISRRALGLLLNSLNDASHAFTQTVIGQIDSRATRLFGVSTPSPQQQIKAVLSHRSFGRTKGMIVRDRDAMRMIDRALSSPEREIRLYCTGFPMKVFNPIETLYQGDSVDLGDVSVLLRFAELARILTHFGKPLGKGFTVVVVSDGRMNAGMFKADPRICDSYVHKLNEMINTLGIGSWVSVGEFFSLLVDDGLRNEYLHRTQKIKAECHTFFDPLLNPVDLEGSISSALTQEEAHYGSSSFGDLFNSTIGSVRYEGIEHLAAHYDLDFLTTYSIMLESILWGQRIEHSASWKKLASLLPRQRRGTLLRELRRERWVTVKTAWHSTIEYFAVMEVNKATQVFNALFPDEIRITTRPKRGQIGVHTSDQNQPSLFSYHSVPVVIPCNRGKNVKVDFQLRSTAILSRCRPLRAEGTDLVCYVHPDVPSDPLEELPWKRGG